MVVIEYLLDSVQILTSVADFLTEIFVLCYLLLYYVLNIFDLIVVAVYF